MKAREHRARRGVPVEIHPDPDGGGYVLNVNGVNLANAAVGMALTTDPRNATAFTLILEIGDVVAMLDLPDARVQLRPDAVKALEALGWTPPADDTPAQVTS